MLYAPEMMLSMWLYAYALGITSARQVERRLVEDLQLHYLARLVGRGWIAGCWSPSQTPSHRGPAGDAERCRQRLADSHGERVASQCGQMSERLFADSGYFSNADIN